METQGDREPGTYVWTQHNLGNSAGWPCLGKLTILQPDNLDRVVIGPT